MSKIRRCPHCWSASLKLMNRGFVVIDPENVETGIDLDLPDLFLVQIPIEDNVDGVECVACGGKSYWKWED